MRDATALVPRLAFRLPFLSSVEKPVIAGFRGDALSLFIQEDEVYHFNDARQLRRVHYQGEMLKAEQSQLIRLRKQRTDSEVQLLRSPLSAEQSAAVLSRLRERVTSIQASADEIVVQQEFPVGAVAFERLISWLGQLADPVEIAATPRLRG